MDVPDVFTQAFVIEKDGKRFPKSGGWGYALFNYEAASDKFTADPSPSDCGHACHVAVKAKDHSMLVDIWIAMARPALELVTPHLRPGAIVVCDNTQRHRTEYADYFAFLEDPANGFRTMTLPFDGGLELSVRG